jgi:Domain of unknown function (DUF4258)
MPHQPHYASETQILRRVARDPSVRFIWTDHASEQMNKRGISAPDVEHALINGQVVLSEAKRDDVWRVEGKDIDCNLLTIEVVVWEDTIKIVTAFRPKGP